MESLLDRWNGHLTENNMGYCEHFRFAFCGAACIIYHGVRLAIHAVLPCFHREALKDADMYTSTKRGKAFWNQVHGQHPESSTNEHINSRISTEWLAESD